MSIAVSSRRLAVTFALATTFLAPSVALAQVDADQPAASAPKPKPAKKPAKKKKPATDTPPPASADDTIAKPPPKDDAKPAAGTAVDADTPAAAPAATDAAAAKADKADKAVVAPDEAAPKEPDANDDTNTFEDPNTRYYFVGARYRGTIIPQFIENLFVDDGGTVYSNSFGFELDMRKGGQSMIPWISYADYSMGDTLFHEKNATPTGQPGDAGNFTVVNSGLKAIYLGLDELWSVPIDKSHHWDFEFGFGVGVGVVFGSLQNNWVFQDNNGNLHGPTASTTPSASSSRISCLARSPATPGRRRGRSAATPSPTGSTAARCRSSSRTSRFRSSACATSPSSKWRRGSASASR